MTTDVVLDGEPMDVLRALFAAHGVEARLEDDWVQLPRGCRARARILEREGSDLVQLDVMLEPWLGTAVLESFAGFGMTRPEQRQDAWRGFVTGSLHVMTAAFLYLEEAPAERTAWEIDGVTRAVTLGPMVTRGDPPPPADLWWDGIKERITGATLPEGTHWVRVFVMHLKGELIVEVLLDNEGWDDVVTGLQAMAWPSAPDFYTVRVFLVIQGGIDVSRAVADLAGQPEADDDELARQMIERGVDPTDASLLVGLVPLAYGRLMLQLLELKVAPLPWANLVSRAGEARRIQLDDDPIFAEAAWLAERGGLDRDHFMAIALRSPEVRAVMQAQAGGAALDQIVWSPTAILVP